MANKFINITDNEENNSSNNNEYSNEIHVNRSKAQDEYIDISNKKVKFFFIALGLFCIVGVIYYVVEWFSSN